MGAMRRNGGEINNSAQCTTDGSIATTSRNVTPPMLTAASTPIPAQAAMAISSEERDFFVAMGARITLLRKTQGITQAQLAELLGVSQQTVQAYEVGRRRIQVSALPLVARALSVSLEELLGEGKPAARSKRGPTPKWEQQIEAIAKLPRARQRFVSEMLDTVLAQH
jgi:transcriptional regulator with XRE-family HTH domain